MVKFNVLVNWGQWLLVNWGQWLLVAGEGSWIEGEGSWTGDQGAKRLYRIIFKKKNIKHFF